MSHDVVSLVHRVAARAAEFLVQYSFQVLGGILILFAGWKLSQRLSRMLVLLFETKSGG